MMDSLIDWFGQAQTGLFEAVVQPLMFHAGLGNFLEDGFNATGWLLVGLIQLAVMVAVFGPLQRLWPAEPLRDRAAVRTDFSTPCCTTWGWCGWRCSFWSTRCSTSCSATCGWPAGRPFTWTSSGPASPTCPG